MFFLKSIHLRLFIAVSFLFFQSTGLLGQETGSILLRMEAMLHEDPGMTDSVRKSFAELIINGRDDPDDSFSAHAALLLATAYGRAGATDVEVFFHAWAGATAWSKVRPSFHLERELRRAQIREQQHKFPGASGRYTDALILAKRAGDTAGMIRATTGLLRVSIRLKDLSDAGVLLKDIRPLAIRLGNERVLADLRQAEGAFHLASGSFTAAMASLEEAGRFHKRVRDSAAFTGDNIYLARALRSLSRWADASSVLNEALAWSAHSTASRVRVLIELAGLHEASGDARKAIQFLKEADALSYSSHPELWMEEVLPALSTRLARIGEAANLEALLQRYLSVRELVQVKRDDAFLAAGKVISEWERLDTSDTAVRDIKRDRNRIMWVLLAFLLSAIWALVVIFRQHQRMQAQLRALFRKNLEEMQQAAEASATQRILETEPPSNLEEATVQARYQAILQLMERDKPWLDPGFSLQDLSTRLATNQKYISQAINMFSETGFSGMMNRYRVNEARRLILEGKPDTSLNDIALEAGFTNRISFYRQFKEITGISPSEFLKLAR
jgi:AraC-like DNA-binding protein